MTRDTNHTYQIDGHTFKQSVTGLVESLCPPFDKERIAGAIAKRDNLNAEDIIAKWDLNGEISRNYGTAIHGAIEYWLTHGENPNQLSWVVDQFKEVWEPIGRISPEIAVYSEELSLCGTMDIFENLGAKKGIIHDIKTNNNLYKEAKGKIKLFDLPATNINKYRLQLSIYKYLLEKLGWEIVELNLWHYEGKWEKITVEPISNIEKIWHNS